jgi:putative transposase
MVQAAADLAPAVGVAAACRALGVPRSAYYRALQPRTATAAVPRADMPGAAAPDGSTVAESARARPTSRALSLAEQAAVRDLLNSERFADLAPREVYATLLAEGVYLCSISTMYRILRATDQVKRRRDQVRRCAYTKPELLATRPRQLWSWDITKLKGPTTWTYF